MLRDGKLTVGVCIIQSSCCIRRESQTADRCLRRYCTCVGCGTLAAQALKVANVRTSALLTRVDRRKPRDREALRAVGRALARVLLCRVCLLLDTDCRGSPRRPALTHAQQCLAQWEKLLRWRFTTQLEASDLVRLLA